jgi:hypothetical protein
MQTNLRHYILFIIASLLVLQALSQQNPPPVAEWISKWEESSLLWTEIEPDLASNKGATVGNGYLATAISSDIVYISGLFNGYNTTTPSHRAK